MTSGYIGDKWHFDIDTEYETVFRMKFEGCVVSIYRDGVTFEQCEFRDCEIVFYDTQNITFKNCQMWNVTVR